MQIHEMSLPFRTFTFYLHILMFHQLNSTKKDLIIVGRAAEAWQPCLPPLWSMYSSPRLTNRDLDSQGWQWSFPWPPCVTLSNNNGEGWGLWRDLWSCRRSGFFLLCLLLSFSVQCVLLFKLTGMLGYWWYSVWKLRVVQLLCIVLS